MLCPYIVLGCFFSTPHIHSCPGVSSCATPSPDCASFPSDSYVALSLAPSRSRPSCSHHHQDTYSPSLQTHRSQKFIISRVAIYCATVFCLLVIYTRISSKTSSPITAVRRRYSHPPSCRRLGCLPVIRCTTLSQNLLRDCSTRGDRTHVSAPKSNTACTNALKKYPKIPTLTELKPHPNRKTQPTTQLHQVIPITKRARLPTFPSTESMTMYIYQT